MNKQMILSTAILLATTVACNNNNQPSTTATVTAQNSIDSNTAADPSMQIGLPTFAMEDMNGNTINLQSLKGKKLFVNLWASWCPPCRAEIPSIEKLYHGLDTNKVAFVLLSLDDTYNKAKKFAASKKMHLPFYYPAETLPDLFNVQAIPTTFIFNENGELVKRIDGGEDYNTKEYKSLLQ